MTHRCPCCGSEVEGESPVVGLPRLAPAEEAIMRILRRIPGRSVSVDDLLLSLYRDREEPDSAHGMLHVHVSRIRKKLGPVIENTYGGYRIRMERA